MRKFYLHKPLAVVVKSLLFIGNVFCFIGPPYENEYAIRVQNNNHPGSWGPPV